MDLPRIDVSKRELGNGLRIYRFRRDTLNAYMRIDIRYGAAYQSKLELAHLLEHMLFKPESEVLKPVKRLAGNLDASVTDSLTTITLSCPKETFCQCAEVVLNMLVSRGSRWNESLLETEKDVVLEEVVGEFDNLERVHEAKFFSLLVSPKYHLAAPPEELERSIRSITLDDLVRESERLDPRISVLFTTDDLECLDVFSEWSGNGNCRPTVQPEPRYGEYYGEKIGRQTFISVGWLAPGLDQGVNMALKLLPAYLTDPDVGVLYERLRYEMGLIYDVYARYVTLPHFGYFYVFTSTLKERSARTIAEIIYEEVEKVRDGDVDEERLSILARRALFSINEILDSVWDSLEILSTNAVLYGDPLYSIRRGIEFLSSVSPERFSSAIRRHISGREKSVLLIS